MSLDELEDVNRSLIWNKVDEDEEEPSDSPIITEKILIASSMKPRKINENSNKL